MFALTLEPAETLVIVVGSVAIVGMLSGRLRRMAIAWRGSAVELEANQPASDDNAESKHLEK